MSDVNQEAVTMFGAYVSRASVSLGWGGQGGSLQLTLVEDEENGIVIPKDSKGNPFSGATTNRNGKLIVAPPTGTACYFKLGKMYFGGIFQRWTYKEDPRSGRTYDIILESPAKFMDGVKLIIENYNGTTDKFARNLNQGESSTNLSFDANKALSYHATYGERSLNKPPFDGSGSVFNVYNLFAYYENPNYGRENTGQDKYDFPSYNRTNYKNFGSSRFNSSGAPARELLYALDQVTSFNPSTVWGGPLRFGVDSDSDSSIVSNKYGVTEFDLLLSEIETVYNQIFPALRTSTSPSWTTVLADLRLTGPVISVNQFLSELSEYHQWDYFYNIEPSGRSIESLEDGGGILLDSNGDPKAGIRVKTVNRSRRSRPNAIRDIINKELDGKTLMSYSMGKEVSDITTQKIIWGARRSRYIEFNGLFSLGSGIKNNSVENSFAVWGRRNKRDEVSYNTIGTAGNVYSSPFRVGGTILMPDGTSYGCTPFELRMALAGKESWQMYKTFETISGRSPQTYGRNLLTSPWTSTVEPTVALLSALNQGIGNNFDLLQTNLSRASTAWQQNREDLCDQLFSAISAVASQSYKQEYLCFIPQEIFNTSYNLYYPEEESQDFRAWRVADSAFITPRTFDEFGRISRLGYAPSADPLFFDASGRMKSIVGFLGVGRFGGRPDFSSLGSDWAQGINGAAGLIISQQGGVASEDRWYGFGARNSSAGQVAVLCKAPAVKVYDFLTTPDLGLTWLGREFLGITLDATKYLAMGKNSVSIAIPPDYHDPIYFGVPQESERFNYGPWVGQRSTSGKAEAIENNQLAPEVFGGYSELNDVGTFLVRPSDVEISQNESGYVQLVGRPFASLGDTFAADGPYITSMDVNIDATAGVTTSYRFNTWTAQFGKLAKYNVDRIAKINRNQWSLAQQVRGEISKPAFPQINGPEKIDIDQLNKRQKSHFDPSGLQQHFKLTSNVNQNNFSF